ncbi:hypothetical protein GCM10010252_76830 [Streptomyces aureoverticillatus]|nr:hypothetical protein GCM10010252_76830 [Streptomyces aureoverticillatus]
MVGVVSEAGLLTEQGFRSGDPRWWKQQARHYDLAKTGASTADEIMTSPLSRSAPG